MCKMLIKYAKEGVSTQIITKVLESRQKNARVLDIAWKNDKNLKWTTFFPLLFVLLSAVKNIYKENSKYFILVCVIRVNFHKSNFRLRKMWKKWSIRRQLYSRGHQPPWNKPGWQLAMDGKHWALWWQKVETQVWSNTHNWKAFPNSCTLC